MCPQYHTERDHMLKVYFVCAIVVYTAIVIMQLIAYGM